MKPASVKGRLGCINAFLRFLIEEGVLRHEILSKRLTVKLPAKTNEIRLNTTNHGRMAALMEKQADRQDQL